MMASGSGNPPGNGDSDEHQRNRNRNNQSVQRCRQKKREKERALEGRVEKLRTENQDLEDSLQFHIQEIATIRETFMSHSGQLHGERLNEEELADLLQDPIITTGLRCLMNSSNNQGPV
ncbi:unnamed protein product [Meganyctiphanes norvegica]|uniref:BZIP domain-containing protein n=1 Tax=Meganyctiphanes norvegica TaxID=48144 RepID=A0AAV2S0S4_MEGNR